MLEIILGIVVTISFLSLIFVIYNNLVNLVRIKIDKAEEDIVLDLQKKSELLDSTRPLIKEELKLDKTMTALDAIVENESNFDVHARLKKAYNEFFKTLDENEKLLKSESLLKILEDLNYNEEDIVGSIKFYNDTVVEYNKLISSFPARIIALFKGYKKLDFYSNEKREIFEILNK